MEQDPYQAPKSEVGLLQEIAVPAKIARKIKGGWIAAVVSGFMTLALMIYVINAGGELSDLINIWNTIDVILIFALAYGIYKKSRFAATCMFVYFLASKILIMVETGKPTGLLAALIFLYFYFNAMVGCYQYHRLLKGLPMGAADEVVD